MADIRINQLPVGSGPVATDFLPLDNGTTRKATIQAVVEIGRPVASQAEAEAGTNPTKVMTPLTTKQSIAFEVGLSLASAAQGEKADTAVQPGTALISALEAIIPMLPTSLPGSPNKLWNNGGLLSIS